MKDPPPSCSCADEGQQQPGSRQPSPGVQLGQQSDEATAAPPQPQQQQAVASNGPQGDAGQLPAAVQPGAASIRTPSPTSAQPQHATAPSLPPGNLHASKTFKPPPPNIAAAAARATAALAAAAGNTCPANAAAARTKASHPAAASGTPDDSTSTQPAEPASSSRGGPQPQGRPGSALRQPPPATTPTTVPAAEGPARPSKKAPLLLQLPEFVDNIGSVFYCLTVFV